MKRLPILAFCLVCAVISIFSLGCPYTGPQYPVQYGNATPTPTSSSVTISGYAFNPAAVTITQGGSVVWTNVDPVTHTVYPDNGSGVCTTNNTLPSGSSVTLTFPTIMTVHYHCSIHAACGTSSCSVTCTGYMTGTVVVQ
jgi:plastocyanin